MSIMYMKKTERTGDSFIKISDSDEDVWKKQGYAKCKEEEYTKAAK